MSATRKPVIVRKLSRDWCAGYAASDFSENDPELELLDNFGKLSRIPWQAVKWVCYLREPLAASLSGNAADNPERLVRRRFSSRPRMFGLWLRLLLIDGEELEGVVSNDRSLIHATGLLLTPPDTRSLTQKVFVPRSTIRELTVLAVVGASPRTADAPAGRLRFSSQPELFADDNSPA